MEVSPLRVGMLNKHVHVVFVVQFRCKMISEILQHWNKIVFVWILKKSQLLSDYSLGPPTGRPLTTPYPMTTSRPTTPAPRPRITPAPTPRPTPRPEIPEFCNVQIQAAVRGEISFVFSYKLLDSNKQKYISMVLNFKSLLLRKIWFCILPKY